MSVIPFYNQENGSSYTATTVGFSIEGASVLIHDIDNNQFADSAKDGNATYNFRIGSEYRDYNDDHITTIDKGDVIYIAAGKSVVVKTKEYVHFPAARYGLILPRVSLLQRGLSTVASKVDPGYRGNLAITIFNHGKGTEKLKYGEQFCSLTVFDVSAHIKPYDKVAKNLKSSGKTLLQRARDAYHRNIGIITALNTFVIIVVILNRYVGFYDILKHIFSKIALWF